jgi:hypothetical protein
MNAPSLLSEASGNGGSVMRGVLTNLSSRSPASREENVGLRWEVAARRLHARHALWWKASLRQYVGEPDFIEAPLPPGRDLGNAEPPPARDS